METAIRLIITVLFIGLIVLAIIFFSLFGVLPAKKLTQVLKGEKVTSTVSQQQIQIKEITLDELLGRIKPLPLEEMNKSEILSSPAIVPSKIPIGSAFMYFIDIRAEANKLVPNEIIIDRLDLLKITFTAVDGDYDVFFPDFTAGISLAKGISAQFQFQASTAGKYEFICNLCKPIFKGTLIVNQRGN